MERRVRQYPMLGPVEGHGLNPDYEKWWCSKFGTFVILANWREVWFETYRGLPTSRGLRRLPADLVNQVKVIGQFRP